MRTYPAEASSFENQPWVLTSGVPVPQDVAIAWPSATFAGGSVVGSTGCNRYRASYTTDGHTLEIGQIASTMMACAPPADAIERAYVSAVGKVRAWRLDGEQLVLVDADGTELLRYAAATPVGAWQVTGLLRGDAFASPLEGTTLTARFGKDGSLSGSAGCNTYKGTYTSEKGTIKIGSAATTRKACAQPPGVMEQEANYFALLSRAVGYSVDGRSLELHAADGTRLVSYARASAS